MSFTKSMILVKTKSLWPKISKVNTLLKTKVNKQPHLTKLGFRASLCQLYRVQPYIRLPISLCQYLFYSKQFNYFTIHNYLLNNFQGTANQYRNFPRYVPSLETKTYLRLL